MSELLTYPYYKGASGLQNFWYPASLSRSVTRKAPSAAKILSVPLVLWRDSLDRPRAFLDVCPHRQAPLSCGRLVGENIACPYHGWTFGIEGQCIKIPASDPEVQPKAKLRPFSTFEAGGLVWVWMGQGPVRDHRPYMTGRNLEEGWKTVLLHQTFESDVEDLIENFMDGPHTAFVHSGVIRAPSEPQPRRVQVSGGPSGVNVEHEPSMENLPLLRLIGKKGPVEVKHRDAFLPPTSVGVTYWLGEEEPSFSALLAMAPSGPQETEVFVSLSIRLGALNGPASLGLPYLARHILKQDADILNLQRKNLDSMTERRTVSVESDYPDIQIRKLRAWLQDPSSEEPFVLKTRDFTLYL